MNKIQQYDEDIYFNDKSKETKVYNLSRFIESQIGITAEKAHDKFNYPLKKFRIIKTHRCFSNGWVNLFEIFPINSNSYSDNAPWIKNEGTITKNLPPDNIIEAFLLELEGELKEELKPPTTNTNKTFFQSMMDGFNKILKTKLV